MDRAAVTERAVESIAGLALAVNMLRFAHASVVFDELDEADVQARAIETALAATAHLEPTMAAGMGDLYRSPDQVRHACEVSAARTRAKLRLDGRCDRCGSRRSITWARDGSNTECASCHHVCFHRKVDTV